MQLGDLTLEVTLFRTDEGGFREGRGESVLDFRNINILCIQQLPGILGKFLYF
jgi:hypothetical protein